MQEHDGHAAFRSRLHDMQFDAVRFNSAVFKFHKRDCLQVKRGGILPEKLTWLNFLSDLLAWTYISYGERMEKVKKE